MTSKRVISGVALVVAVAVGFPLMRRERSWDPRTAESDTGFEPVSQVQGLLRAERSAPVPGTQIKVTLVSIHANDINDGNGTGDEDEVFMKAWRGVGPLNNRHYQEFQLGNIRAGATLTLNKVVYEGPRVLVGIPYIALDFWEGDDGPFNGDDHLGGPAYVRYEGDALRFSPPPHKLEETSAAMKTAQWTIDGDDAQYVVVIKAELY